MSGTSGKIMKGDVGMSLHLCFFKINLAISGWG